MSPIAEIKKVFQNPPPWSEAWQLPTLIAGVVLFGLGIVVSYQKPEPPDYAGILQSAAQYLRANNVEDAGLELDKFETIFATAPKSTQARYHQLRGDATYLNVELIRFEGKYEAPENYQYIVQQYDQAQRLGASFDPTRLQRWAESLVALDREDQALLKIREIPDDQARRRYAVIKQIIQRELRRHGKLDQVVDLLAMFRDELAIEPDRDRRRVEEIWAVGLEAQAMIDAGRPIRAIETLQRQMIYFMDQAADEDLAPLRVKLAKAYQLDGKYEDAQHQFRLAEQRLDKTDALNAEILIGLADIELVGIKSDEADSNQAADLRRALEFYSAAESNYPSSDVYLDALIGAAYCEARLGDHPEAIDHFRRAVGRLVDNQARQPHRVDRLTDLVLAQHGLNFQREEYDLALDYLEIVRPLFSADDIPPAFLAKFAESHQAIAEGYRADVDRLARIDPLTITDEQQAPTQAARRLANREAAIHYNKAADHFLRHAKAVTISNDEEFGISLWQAARCFSEAQNWAKAIDTFSEFIASRPGDANHLEAIHQLGLAYQADGQFNTARQSFEQLINLHPTTLEAYNSIVPLSQCLIALDNIDEAKRWLNYVIDGLVTTTSTGDVVGGGITPDSVVYRDALIELGKLHYQLNEFEDAIRRLSEATDPARYGATEQGPSLRFYLADANRLSIPQIDQELDGPLTPTQRQLLMGERAKRLEQAQNLFGQVIAELEAREAHTLSPLETIFHRNSYFFRADAAFDLGRYEHAISLYDLAAKRFEQHPAALVAMIQIVNAYCELDDPQQARINNERARWLLKRIPDDRFNDPTLPMTRKHWQDWLRWTSELELFAGDTKNPGRRPVGADG